MASGLPAQTFLAMLNEFVDYVCKFYSHEDGLYPIATRSEIEAAIGEYLTEPHDHEICFDSYDRERVRQILQPDYILI